MLIMYLLVRR